MVRADYTLDLISVVMIEVFGASPTPSRLGSGRPPVIYDVNGYKFLTYRRIPHVVVDFTAS